MPTLVLPELDSVQYDEVTHPARYRVWPWGRRRGKSSGVCCAGTAVGWEGGYCWWALPSHPIAGPAWRVMRSFGQQIREGYEGVQIRTVDRMLQFPSGGFFQIRSADNPDSLVAEGLDLVIFDECGLHKVRTWEESVGPTLMDRMGRAIFCGVPKGTQGLLWYAWQRALDPLATDWHGRHQTTFDNPHLPQAAKDAIRADYEAGRISERYYRQEYLAEFMAAEGLVFRNIVDVCSGAPLEEPEEGHTYVVGVDFGKRHDFMVFSVFDVEERRQVYLDRFRKVEYELAKVRLGSLVERWGIQQAVCEDTGVGDPVIEGLERAGLPIVRFHTTPATKEPAVDRLALAFEGQSVTMLEDPLQVAEFQAFEAKVLPSGRTRYAGPDNGHDDMVMAAVFAWTAIDQGGGEIGGMWL